jgi:hypothetical protein
MSETQPNCDASDSPRSASAISNDRRNSDDTEYAKFREQLLNREWDVAKEYDKWLLTVSGVLLGFSLTLVKDLVRPAGNELHVSAFLWLGWLGLSLPLMLCLISLHLSYTATGAYLKILDRTYAEYDQLAEFWPELSNRLKCVKRTQTIGRLNIVGLISFVVGVVSLAVFVAFNVEGAKHVQKTSPTTTATQPASYP